MESARVVASEFRIDQRHIPRLIEVGEFFAAGFLAGRTTPLSCGLPRGCAA